MWSHCRVDKELIFWSVETVLPFFIFDVVVVMMANERIHGISHSWVLPAKIQKNCCLFFFGRHCCLVAEACYFHLRKRWNGLVYKNLADLDQISFIFAFLFMFKVSFESLKNVDGVIGIQTQASRMKGADESTKLWLAPDIILDLIQEL